MSTADETVALALQDIGYDFASATVGLEFGSPRHFSFFVRAGISYWSFNVTQSEALLQAALVAFMPRALAGTPVPWPSLGPHALHPHVLPMRTASGPQSCPLNVLKTRC